MEDRQKNNEERSLSYGRRLSAAMNARNMSIKELAEQTGLTKKRIERLFSGEARLRMQEGIALCDTLRIPLDLMFREIEPGMEEMTVQFIIALMELPEKDLQAVHDLIQEKISQKQE